MCIGAVGYSNELYHAGFCRNNSTDKASNYPLQSEYDGACFGIYDEDANCLTAQDLKEDKAWREMSDEEWEKILEDVDEYIEAFKERLEQMKETQEEAAQDMEKVTISKLQEVQLTESTVVGVSRKENVTECASVEEDENEEKIWTITCFGEDGIVSTRCKNGKIIDRWEIEYSNPGDAERVWDFLAKFESDADLKFAGSKDFWEEFLTSNMDGDSL